MSSQTQNQWPSKIYSIHYETDSSYFKYLSCLVLMLKYPFPVQREERSWNVESWNVIGYILNSSIELNEILLFLIELLFTEKWCYIWSILNSLLIPYPFWELFETWYFYFKYFLSLFLLPLLFFVYHYLFIIY